MVTHHSPSRGYRNLAIAINTSSIKLTFLGDITWLRNNETEVSQVPIRYDY
jgi:hypothetical protein